jgi:hypothetical protein
MDSLDGKDDIGTETYSGWNNGDTITSGVFKGLKIYEISARPDQELLGLISINLGPKPGDYEDCHRVLSFPEFDEQVGSK